MSTPSSSSSAGRTKAGAPKPKRAPKKRNPVVPDTPGTARIVAIANQKGGVGKSTTAVSLGAALADIGYRVLVVDLDPQGNASTGLGIRHDARDVTVYDVVVAEAPLEDAIVATQTPRLDAIPSTIDLAGAEIELVSQFSREGRLKRALEPVREGRYDFIFFDCPPSLGLLTVNALTAAEELIVPIQCEYYALEGLGQLLRNVGLVQQNINPSLRLTGIVMTMFDPRTKLSEQVVAEVRKHFGEVVYDVIIPRTVRLSEAPGFGQPITTYDPKSRGAESYRELAREVALRPPPAEPMRVFDLPASVAPATMGRAEAREATPVTETKPIPAPAPEPAPKPAPEPVPELASAPAPAREQPPAPKATPPPKPKAGEKPGAAPKPKPSPTPQAAAPRKPAPAPPATSDAEDVWSEEEVEERVRPAPEAVKPGRLPERRVVVIDESQDLDIKAAQEPLVQTTKDGAPVAEQSETAEIGATLRDDDGSKRRWRLFRKGGE